MKTFSCGCKFETDDAGKVIFNPDITKLDLECPATWDLVCEGNTKGIFQLESQLGRSLSKQAKPRNISELSDLIAIMRPGCLDSMVNGKSLTMHYVDRKHGIDSVMYLHDALEPILQSTQGILVYQEQAMKIATDIGGFDLQEADTLRKAIGKKQADVMAQVKTSFLEKAVEKGIVNKVQAEEIFSWIEKSQRYSFNKSHSISYAYNSYLTAYAKAHFPREFFTAYLKHSIGKPDTFWEVHELVNNAKTMDIHVMSPSIQHMNEHFQLIGENPTYGITNIKNVGSSVFKKLMKHIESNEIDISECGWDCFLIRIAPYVNKKAFSSLILAGAFDCFNIGRSKMLHYFNIMKEFTSREQSWLNNYKIEHPEVSAKDTITAMVEASRVKDKNRPIFRKDRIPMIEDLVASYDNPGYDLYDSPSWIAKKEEELLGIALTCNKVEDYDTSKSNCSCKEFLDGFNTEHGIALAVQIDSVREWTIKKGKSKGQKMGFVTVSDASCSLDNITAFSEEWDKYKKLLHEGNTVLMRGSKDKNRGSFLIKKVEQLTS
jgi:DNA polymerase III alpha subunit|tara:strand:+ start:132 stop:1769 length:1638 start_codon:yes stop_codon:yes gene_type:complete